MELFIAGTDTGAGKTFITAALCAGLLRAGFSVGVQKWVSTGSRRENPDLTFVRLFVKTLLGERAAESVIFSCPYCFSYPSSPHLASEIDGQSVKPEKILSEYKKVRARTDILLIEGTGGIMVPVTRDLLFADLLQSIKPLTILVARSGLGTINHCLLSLEALENRGIETAGVVLNSIDTAGKEDGTSERIVRDNRQIISQISGVEVFGPVPFIRDFSGRDLWKEIDPVIKKIRELV